MLRFIETSLNSISFRPGEKISLSIRMSSENGIFPKVYNVSIDYIRAERQRNQLAFGFGVSPTQKCANTLEITGIIPGDMLPGLHLINEVTISKDPDSVETETFKFSPIFFVICNFVELPFDKERLYRLISRTQQERQEYRTATIRTEAAEVSRKSKLYKVIIFGVGCLINSEQQLEGYSIIPLRSGLSHKRLHEVVNDFLAREGLGSIQFTEDIEREFARSIPTFSVSYESIEAVDHTDAINYCSNEASLVFQILGLERGQKPRQFACVAIDFQEGLIWHVFNVPGYRGNLLSDFNPSSVANQIERVIPKIQSSPFHRLLLKTYADATAEESSDFSLLRCWAVLELIADRKLSHNNQILQHPDGTTVLNARGNPETTNSKLGRVFQYIIQFGFYRAQGAYENNGQQLKYVVGDLRWSVDIQDRTEHFAVWDIVRAAYMIRNAVAHEGYFDVLRAKSGDFYEQTASRLVESGPIDLYAFVKEQAWFAFLRELS